MRERHIEDDTKHTEVWRDGLDAMTRVLVDNARLLGHKEPMFGFEFRIGELSTGNAIGVLIYHGTQADVASKMESIYRALDNVVDFDSVAVIE